jgi:hypothetical protein
VRRLVAERSAPAGCRPIDRLGLQDVTMTLAPRIRVLSGLIAVLALAGLTVASLLAITPPSPKPADAPASVFSAGRAYQHVQTIGQHVHVAGSAAEDDVRRYIVDTLTGLGLQPRIQDAVGETDALGGPAMARVSNVVTVIPGSHSTGRLFLVAHYDSVQVSYGANDDGSGIATLLETARALRAGSPLRNDIVLVATDAEEACLCGAEAFVHSDPLAANGGVVLNFESRGSSGPAIMFETAAGNADLIAQYAAAVPYPVATSMAVEVYRILPNDTDFTEFRTSGRFTGLNSAYIDGSATYHSPEDRPDYMDLGSLQSQGSNALALARQLGDADLAALATPGSEDATYFPVLGSLVRYPGWLVWPVAVLAAVAVGALAVAVRRRTGIGWGRMAAGLGLAVLPLLLAAVVAQLFWMLLVAIRPGYAAMLDPWRPGWYRAAVCALVLLVVTGWYALLRRRFTPWGLAVGAFGVLAVLGLLMAYATPGGSYLAALPALIGSVLGIVAVTGRSWWVRLPAVTVAGAVSVLVLAPTVLLFFPALGLATGAAAALVAAMLGVALLPVLEYLHPDVQDHAVVDEAVPSDDDDATDPEVRATTGVQRALRRTGRPRLAASGLSIVAAVLAVAFTVTGLSVDTFSARYPAPTQLMYALDADTHTAYWVSQQTDPGGWTTNFVTGTKDLSAEFPLLHGDLATGTAKAADLPAPTLSVGSDQTSGDTRTLTVTIHPNRDVRLVTLSAPDVTVLSATAQGREMSLPDHGFQLLFHAPPAAGVTVHLVVRGTDPIRFRVMGGSDGLADLPGFVPRPDGVGVQGSHTSELVLVASSVTV